MDRPIFGGAVFKFVTYVLDFQLYRWLFWNNLLPANNGIEEFLCVESHRCSRTHKQMTSFVPSKYKFVYRFQAIDSKKSCNSGCLSFQYKRNSCLESKFSKESVPQNYLDYMIGWILGLWETLQRERNLSKCKWRQNMWMYNLMDVSLTFSHYMLNNYLIIIDNYCRYL